MPTRPAPARLTSQDSPLLRIARRMARVTDITAALESVAGDISALIPFTHCDICLLDRPGWVVSHETGIRTRWSRASSRIDHAPIRDLLLGQCEVMLSDDATRDPRYTFAGATCEPILNHQLRSRVSVLLQVEARTIGALNLSHSEIGLYGPQSVAQARQIAAILAPWFHILHRADRARRSPQAASDEGLRRGALELTRAMEHERQRIGMDLHDQTLADLSRLLREVTADPVPGASGAAGNGLDGPALAARLRQTIDDLRRIIDTAVPTLLELFGYAHAVRVHLERAARDPATRLEVTDLTQGAPDRLDPTVRTALFHITQEAINNATRHARAGHISVLVQHAPPDSSPASGGAPADHPQDQPEDQPEDQPGAGPEPQTLVITIRDDGCGIPATPARQSGLMHMRTRARLISAGLEIRAQNGTVVQVTLRAAA